MTYQGTQVRSVSWTSGTLEGMATLDLLHRNYSVEDIKELAAELLVIAVKMVAEDAA